MVISQESALRVLHQRAKRKAEEMEVKKEKRASELQGKVLPDGNLDDIGYIAWEKERGQYRLMGRKERLEEHRESLIEDIERTDDPTEKKILGSNIGKVNTYMEEREMLENKDKKYLDPEQDTEAFKEFM